MTKKEFRQKLDSLSETEFEKMRHDIGGGGITRDWYVDDFVRKTEVRERIYAHYFDIPTEQDRQNQATISAAESAKVSAEAAVASARHAGEAVQHANESNRIAEESNTIAKEASHGSGHATRLAWIGIGIALVSALATIAQAVAAFLALKS